MPPVIPAKAGIHAVPKKMDSRLRGNDSEIGSKNFCNVRVNIHATVMRYNIPLSEL